MLRIELDRYEWRDIEKTIDKLVQEISNLRIRAIHGLPRGGVIVAALLCYRTGLPLDDGDLYDEIVCDWVFPKEQRGEVLIVDDVCDTGKTLQFFYEAGFTTAALFARSTTLYTPDFHVHWIIHDKYLLMPWETSIGTGVKTSGS